MPTATPTPTPRTVPTAFNINAARCRKEDLRGIYGSNLELGDTDAARWEPNAWGWLETKSNSWIIRIYGSPSIPFIPVLSCNTIIYDTEENAIRALEFDIAVARIEFVREDVRGINEVDVPAIGEESLAVEVSEMVRTDSSLRRVHRASTIVMFRRLNVVVKVEDKLGTGTFLKQAPPVDRPAGVARLVDRLLLAELDRVTP